MIDQEKLNSEEGTNFHAQQDDEYGLPTAEYSPLEYEQPAGDVYAVEEDPAHVKREINVKQDKEEERSSWPIWVAMIVLFAAGGFALYYFVFNKKEEVVLAPVVTTVQEAAPEPEPFIEETPAPVEEWTPPVQKEGSVTAISAKTGRYYVIIGSFIDGDMARDYAQKLAKGGTQVTLIEPTGDRKFYRLGVMEAASFSEANDELDNLKSTFGQDIWIVRY